jgi:hypothetical protein
MKKWTLKKAYKTKIHHMINHLANLKVNPLTEKDDQKDNYSLTFNLLKL